MILEILHVSLGLIIVFLIIIQQRGGLGGSIFGSSTDIFFQRRGLEKRIFFLTWILIVFFILVSILRIF